MTRSPNSYAVVRSLQRGLEILGLFTEHRREWTVTDMATELDLPVPSAYRIVNTLEMAGYLRRSQPRGPLMLSLKFAQLGALVLSGLNVREVAAPVLRRLAVDVGETSMLLIPQGGTAVCVENIEGSAPIRPRSIPIGEQIALNCGATPLVLLAFKPEADRERIISSNEFSALTEFTLVRPDDLRKRVDEIRDFGVAYSRDETVLGTAAVAAPIFGSAPDLVVGAVGISGVVERIVGLEETVRNAGTEISRLLGAAPESAATNRQ